VRARQLIGVLTAGTHGSLEDIAIEIQL